MNNLNIDKNIKCAEPKLIVLSGPSGVGKGTVCDILFKTTSCIVKSISVTTRQPRTGEEEGKNYFYRTKEQYDEIKANDGFLETFEIYGNYYGTPKFFVDKNLDEGKSVLLEIDVQGALEIKRIRPDCVLIFLAPPNIDELKSRLKGRNSESEESYFRRIQAAENEIKKKDLYDYVVVNDNPTKAANEIKDIVLRYITKA